MIIRYHLRREGNTALVFSLPSLSRTSVEPVLLSLRRRRPKGGWLYKFENVQVIIRCLCFLLLSRQLVLTQILSQQLFGVLVGKTLLDIYLTHLLCGLVLAALEPLMASPSHPIEGDLGLPCAGDGLRGDLQRCYRLLDTDTHQTH